jgi:hypothetical protein
MPSLTSSAVIASASLASGPTVTFCSFAPFFVGSTTVNVYSRSLMETLSTWASSSGAFASAMKSLNATWVAGLVFESRNCQIAKNIVAIRTQSRSVLWDCFTTTSRRTAQSRAPRRAAFAEKRPT